MPGVAVSDYSIYHGRLGVLVMGILASEHGLFED